MKETGIIMSGDHPLKCQDGSKTMTRRVIKKPNWFGGNPKSTIGSGGIYSMGDISAEIKYYNEHGPNPRGCPYGQVGDRLWVREKYAIKPQYDKLSVTEVVELYGKPQDIWYDSLTECFWTGKTRPSIFMPRWASRITLEITEVRAERVQEISEADVIKEGVLPSIFDIPDYKVGDTSQVGDISLLSGFKSLWDSLNAKRGYSWESNCWVWVLAFKLIKSNEGA